MGMAMMLLLIPAVSTTAQVNAIPQTSSQDTQKRKITGQVLDDQGEPLRLQEVADIAGIAVKGIMAVIAAVEAIHEIGLCILGGQGVCEQQREGEGCKEFFHCVRQISLSLTDSLDHEQGKVIALLCITDDFFDGVLHMGEDFLRRGRGFQAGERGERPCLPEKGIVGASGFSKPVRI